MSFGSTFISNKAAMLDLPVPDTASELNARFELVGGKLLLDRNSDTRREIRKPPKYELWLS